MIPWSEKIYDMTPEQLEEYKSTYKEAYNNFQDKKERKVMNGREIGRASCRERV